MQVASTVSSARSYDGRSWGQQPGSKWDLDVDFDLERRAPSLSVPSDEGGMGSMSSEQAVDLKALIEYHKLMPVLSESDEEEEPPLPRYMRSTKY